MLIKKLFRTIWIYKTQFLSMIIMTMLGVGIFVGFNVEWHSIEQNTAIFFEETGFADYRIVSSEGYSEEDVSKIEDIYGQDFVTRFLALDAQVENTSDSLSLTVVENIDVSGFVVMEGQAYDALDDDGIWIAQAYADENNLELGDTLELTYNGFSIEGTIKGLISSSEYMICVKDSSQIMPDYESYGYAYISPQMMINMIGYEFYSQIHVISEENKATFIETVDAALEETSMILTKDETISYAGSQGEVEEGKIMGSILPVLFLLIAVLTMVTTMYRIANNEQIQIGTLKALGFKDRKILIHYMMYALVIGVVGILLGLVLGYQIAYFIINPQGSMGTYLEMPYWDLYTPSFVYLALIVVLLLLVTISIFAVHRILKFQAAEILRVKISKEIKAKNWEKSGWFHKCSFSTRWNLRDVIHHKSRTLMTLFGVIGCMIILIGSLGMYDTMYHYVEENYSGTMNYTNKVYLSDNINEETIEDILDLYIGDTSASVSVKIEDKAVSFDIYSITSDLVKFLDQDNNVTVIEDDGAYICSRIANEFDLEQGDSFVISPYGTNEEYTLIVVGVLNYMTESIVVSQTYANEIGIDYTVGCIYTNVSDVVLQSGIKTVQSKEELISTFDAFIVIMNTMIFLLVVVGIILGTVVLYNLGIMAYTERYREMATLKVLGFRDKKIALLLISQNFWLSMVGIIIGLPLGYATLIYLMQKMGSEYEMIVYVTTKSYIISVLLCIGVTLIVSFMVSRKNKHIDMVEALKSPE